MKATFLSAGALALMLAATGGWADDVEKGKATFESKCADCHFEDDFAGEAKEDIAAMIQGLVNGEVEHKGEASGLTEEEVAVLAAFFASAE